MATQVVELTGDEAALLRSLDRVIKKQMEHERSLRDTGIAGDAAGTSIEAALAKVQREGDKALKGMLSELRTMGPEGAAAAEALKGHFIETGKAGFRSIDSVLEQIKLIDPQAAAAADGARRSLGEAANDAERQFQEVLDELKSMGPEGRKAAEEIKAKLVEAGHISERSIEDVAKAFEKIDPEAAKAANAIIANMKRGTGDSTSMFQSFGKAAVAEISAIAGAYIGVQEAIAAVNDYLEEQRQRVLDVAAAQTELAAVQEGTSKNLAGLEKADRLGLLEKAPDIAIQTDTSPKIITEALGTVASTGLNDPAKIEDIVRKSAQLTRLTPEELPEAAAGAADILAKTGLDDIRQTISLFLTTGAQSLVADPAKLQAALPRALGAGIVSAPNQNREDAARETAAIFAQATNIGTDPQGASSATFTIDFLNRMGQFFEGMERQRVEARSKIELIDRKIEKGKDTELDRLKKKEAEEFLAASEGVTDPGTQFGRLAALQGNEALAREFTGEKGFGEQQFKPFLKEILDPNSKTAKAVRESKEGIKADVASFEQQAQELVSSTSEISGAAFEKGVDALLEASKLQKKDTGALGRIRKATSEALAQADAGGIGGFFDRMFDTSARMGSNASDAALEAIQYLQVRRTNIERDGITGDDAKNIALLNATMEKIFAYVERDAQVGAINRKDAAAVAEQANRLAQDHLTAPDYRESFERLANLLERVATSNEKMVEPSKATAENTAKQPAVTGAIGATQP